MAASRQVDLLEPIDLADHLDKIELYLGQVCQIAGISKMQLDYWTNKAHIPTKGRKQRIYDMDALETVMLIKQAKDKGLNLGAAIEAAQRFRELNGDPDESPRHRLVGLGASSRRRAAASSGGSQFTYRPAPSSSPAKTVSLGTTSKCQWAPVCNQAFNGTGPSCSRRARIARRRSASAEARSLLSGLGLVRTRRDQQLVRNAAGRSGS